MSNVLYNDWRSYMELIWQRDRLGISSSMFLLSNAYRSEGGCTVATSPTCHKSSLLSLQLHLHVPQLASKENIPPALQVQPRLYSLPFYHGFVLKPSWSSSDSHTGTVLTKMVILPLVMEHGNKSIIPQCLRLVSIELSMSSSNI